MDLDKDGHRDVLSGSYPGELYLFRGKADGSFAKAETLKDTNGKQIQIEAAASPHAVDWDNDGDFDLIVGFIQGPVRLMLNKGNLRFGAATPLKAAGKVIEAGDGGPLVADWDRDGVKDLLLGTGEGQLLFYKASKGNPTPTLAAPVKLIAAVGEDAWAPREMVDESKGLLSPMKPGVRLKPAVADWNGDGKLDLLVGDYISIAPKQAQLTDSQKQELKALEKREQELYEKMGGLSQKAYEASLKELGLKEGQEVPSDKRQKLNDIFMKKVQTPEYEKLTEELQEIQKKTAPLRQQPESAGFVWVYPGR